MESAATSNPPRNGEGDHAQHGGGALAASRPDVERARQLRRQMSLPEALLWRALTVPLPETSSGRI
jgi:hypothetical protein